MKIGVLSDTHGWLDPQIKTRFAGVDHIVHAGDVGDAFIAFELEQMAPLTVVLGNTDLGLTFPLTAVVELAGRKLLVQHIVNPLAPDEKLAARLAREKPDMVIFGHTHRRFCETHHGSLFFNPGYAGKPKLGTERWAALLHSEPGGWRPEFLAL